MTGLGRRPAVANVLVELALLALAASVFSVATLGYQALAGRPGRPVWWVLALAAIAVAALLPACRPQVARRIRRLVLGEQEAASYEAVSDFISRMTTALDVDEVLPRLAEAAARSVHSTRGEVSVRLADGRQWRQIWPEVATAPAAGENFEDLSVPVQHGGSVVGEIGASTAPAEIGPGDREVLGELAAPAGVALATVRLTVELRQRVRQLADLASELQACQARVVGARSEERRRLLAKVETAVLPRLAETDKALGALAGAVNSAGAPGRLDEARAAARSSLDALRGVARGIFPNLLTDAGIAIALRSWGEERVPPVDLVLRGDVSSLRSLPAVEAALYFASVSALDDPAEDGDRRGGTGLDGPGGGGDRGPGPIELEVEASAGSVPNGVWMSVSVQSGVPVVSPSTMQAIRDRIGALGGTVEVKVGAGGEARMEVRLPLGTRDEALGTVPQVLT